MTATAQDIAVRCSGVTKTYGSGDAAVSALRGVDLEVRRGELFMLVGPSGCGKTTLLSVITAILRQDHGRCAVFGHDFAAFDDRSRAHFRGTTIGFVFQAFNLLPSLTALENVTIPLLINRATHKQAERRAREVLALVGLETRTSARPTELSGGQQQRVAIARALVHDPKLIVCDEPTSNLDYQTGQAMMELLRERAKSAERAMIVVTHDARIYAYADRIARMEDGRIVELLEGAARTRLQ
jgi:putative ABC transport system ATP-binding protein